VSNEIINSWQRFLDNAGQPNSNGQIEFFTDAGRGTPKDIFQDAALTIAQSNPYLLDDSGRIRGDVHYEGTATLVHTDNTTFEFRQDDEITVSSDGLTGGITIDESSVASMVANQGLALGSVVRTRGYYSPNLFGGARYLVVAGGTGTDDNYRFHNLGNGLQAQLLDLEDNNNFLVAGARGDGGTNDQSAMQAVINQGGDIFVEGNFIFVADNLTIPVNCRFIGFGEMKQRNGATGDFLQIVAVAVSSVKFRDVILDGNQPNTNPDNSTFGWVLP